ncbi:MAG TPA: 50S ribosomal protein L29 [Candidatus Angelobacter sp.]|jgi:large subunit ribosomal protein L29|nr:50S ribosomal protein L29 [Candidatus Angelobacter sp.]
MKMKDLRGLSVPDLQKKLKDSRQELFNLRFQMATGQLQNHRQIRHVRRNLAQILTELFLKEADGDSSETAVVEDKPKLSQTTRQRSQRSRRSSSAEAKS